MTLLAKPALRVVLCRGEFCNLGRRADILYKRLSTAVDDINRAQATPCIGLRTANCLSMCGAGPNLVIYPQDAVFHHLDLDGLETVIREYLQQAAGDTD